MSEIVVAPWGTRQELPKDPSAPMHTALWNVATEQAILARMKKHNEDWATAAKQVSNKDVVEHLDVVCDDNGFRRLDGRGSGRDPNLIVDGERIKVRIDPQAQTVPVTGVDQRSPKTLAAYNEAAGNSTNTGWVPQKKEQLDTYLGDIPGFAKLSDDTKAALIEAHGREGVNTLNLAKLTGSELFQNALNKEEQKHLLATYGVKGKELITTEADKLATQPVNEHNTVRLRVLSTASFATLSGHQQQQFLDRLSQDGSFRAGVATIIKQENFTGKSTNAQGFALDILRRYSSRKGEGYGEIEPVNRAAVLVKLYDDVLATDKFKLGDTFPFGHLQTAQDKMIEDFARNEAGDVRPS